MTEPTFTPTMEDLWRRLPAVHRDEDAKRDWPFKRWLASMVDQAGDIEHLVDRINYLGYWEEDADPNDTSDLIDPLKADAAWLPWIGMVRGIRVPSGSTTSQTRLALSSLYSYRAGTKRNMMDYVKSLLSDTKFCQIFDHTADDTPIGAGTRWQVLIVTRQSETLAGYDLDSEDPDIVVVNAPPDPDDPDIVLLPDNPDPIDPDINTVLDDDPIDIVRAVIDAGLKPAGVLLYHKFVGAATWDSIEADFPTWDDWDAAGSWDALLAISE